ncbi:MAG: amidophosphoribosyltransferase [Elusimicrobia bacterium]|nr:amidophosphoribosyltransferase [Elusimicrobiota bacterium]
MFNKLNEKCGVFGVFGHLEAARLAYLGLYALQHRGQESAGIVTSDGRRMYSYLGMGLVADIFNRDNLDKLPGYLAIGHNRYSTTGLSYLKNVQPLLIKYAKGQLAIAHNGNLINTDMLREQLEKEGSIFQSTSDTEVILHLIAKANGIPLEDAIIKSLRQIKGAYSLLLSTPDTMIAVRDPYGVRPLCLGKLGEAYVIASETCALDLINAKYIRDIEPGELLIINEKGLKSIKFATQNKSAMCIFEFIYFSRPDSYIFGRNVHMIRREYGKQLALETKIKADLVIPVPDSANSAAVGYAEQSGIPFETGLIRNHYIGRTFIEPDQQIRDFGAKIKYNPVREVLKNKKVIVIDDSIVRGTTSKKLVKMLYEAGARQVHLCISSPPIIGPCFYGIDTPTKKELIASSHTVKQIKEYLGVESLHYLSREGLLKATKIASAKFCCACFNDEYPIK